jgi:hypothetical protein
MSRQFAFAAPMIALASLLVPAVFTSRSHAETCIAAPTAPAPQGSHWYYRLERGTQRKCWRLVKLERQPRESAKVVAPEPQPADVEDTAAAETPAGRVVPAAPQHGWLTRSASAVPEAAAAQGAFERAGEPADDQAAAPPPIPGGAGQASEARAPVASVQAAEPTPPSVAQSPAAVPAGTGMIQFVFVAIAGIGLFAAAMFILVELRRRRTDVLTRIARADDVSFEPRPDAGDAPTFAPMPPMRLMPQHDDVEEAVQRSRRRRMAA